MIVKIILDSLSDLPVNVKRRQFDCLFDLRLYGPDNNDIVMSSCPPKGYKNKKQIRERRDEKNKMK